MTKTIKGVLRYVYLNGAAASGTGDDFAPTMDVALKELETLTRDEIARARIDSLEYAKIAPKYKIEQRIAELKESIEEK